MSLTYLTVDYKHAVSTPRYLVTGAEAMKVMSEFEEFRTRFSNEGRTITIAGAQGIGVFCCDDIAGIRSDPMDSKDYLEFIKEHG